MIFFFLFQTVINAEAAKKVPDLKPKISATEEIKKQTPSDDLSGRLTQSFDTLSIGKQNMRITPEGTYYTREKARIEIENENEPVDDHTKSQKRGGAPR
jgi:hypothetical protein